MSPLVKLQKLDTFYDLLDDKTVVAKFTANSLKTIMLRPKLIVVVTDIGLGSGNNNLADTHFRRFCSVYGIGNNDDDEDDDDGTYYDDDDDDDNDNDN